MSKIEERRMTLQVLLLTCCFRCITSLIFNYYFSLQNDMPLLKFTLQHWVLWNLFSEVQVTPLCRSIPWHCLSCCSSLYVMFKSVERIRLEDFSPDIAYNLCIKYSDNKRCPSLDKFKGVKEETLKINHAHTQHMNATTWTLLKRIDFNYTLLCQKMALRYGYEVDNRDLLSIAKDPSSRER